jgi:hypothetical protein
MLRPILAWIAASLASAVIGASLFVGLVAAYGLWDPAFMAPIWAGLIAAGTILALVGGGAAALVLTRLTRRFEMPRPVADMAAGAVGASAILLGVQAFILGRMEQPWTPPDLGPVLFIPLAAGALAGWVYWRLALARG